MKYHHFKNASVDQLDELSAEFGKLIDYFSEKFDLELYANFGTLLGIVRSNDFIPDDHDVDACYLSKFRTKPEVLDEMKNLHRELHNLGMLRKSWAYGQAFVELPGSPLVIDMFTSWIDEGGNYWTCQWGNFGPAEQFFPTRIGRLRNEYIPIPQNAEIIIERLYGPDWRTPKEEHPRKYLKRKQWLLT